MQKLLKTSIAIIVILAANVAHSEPSSAHAEIAKLLSEIGSIQADFTQTVKNQQGRVIQESAGTMYLKTPHHFRWDTKVPFNQQIISTKELLWVYDVDLEQAIKYNADQMLANTPARLLSDQATESLKQYTVREIEKDSDLVWFELTPIKESTNDNFHSIKVAFLNRQIHRMMVYDQIGQVTLIRFNSIKSHNIQQAFFDFRPPKFVDVIDNTNHVQ